jgi:hypothetical protein
MPVNADSGKSILKQEAKALIQRFRDNDALYQEGDTVKGIRGGFYGKNKILAILNQPDCIGLRYYHGVNSSGQLVVVLAGEDSSGTGLDGVLVNEGPLCPPFCSITNSLDS